MQTFGDNCLLNVEWEGREDTGQRLYFDNRQHYPQRKKVTLTNKTDKQLGFTTVESVNPYAPIRSGVIASEPSAGIVPVGKSTTIDVIAKRGIRYAGSWKEFYPELWIRSFPFPNTKATRQELEKERRKYARLQLREEKVGPRTLIPTIFEFTPIMDMDMEHKFVLDVNFVEKDALREKLLFDNTLPYPQTKEITLSNNIYPKITMFYVVCYRSTGGILIYPSEGRLNPGTWRTVKVTANYREYHRPEIRIVNFPFKFLDGLPERVGLEVMEDDPRRAEARIPLHFDEEDEDEDED